MVCKVRVRNRWIKLGVSVRVRGWCKGLGVSVRVKVRD